jgi:hypothetical protein
LIWDGADTFDIIDEAPVWRLAALVIAFDVPAVFADLAVFDADNFKKLGAFFGGIGPCPAILNCVESWDSHRA